MVDDNGTTCEENNQFIQQEDLEVHVYAKFYEDQFHILSQYQVNPLLFLKRQKTLFLFSLYKLYSEFNSNVLTSSGLSSPDRISREAIVCSIFLSSIKI